MTKEGLRRSSGILGGGSNGDITPQLGDFGKRGSTDDGKPTRFSTIVRVFTVIAYVVCVSTAAALLSAYYIFLWEPQPTDPLNRPSESPYSLAQHGHGHHGNSHSSGGSYYLYPKNAYSGSDSRHSPPERSKKSRYKTTALPNFLPKPQHLSWKRPVSNPTPPAA